MILGCSCAVFLLAGTEVRSLAKPAAQTSEARRKPPAAGYISGMVTSANGPEAGVWVIAETLELGTKYRKIVVTDDQGRYLIPDLPKAKYHVWVRGYGLVDSDPMMASPGDTLALTAVVAPAAKDAAQYFPPDYWFSLLQMPAKSDFPMTISGRKNARAQTASCQGHHIPVTSTMGLHNEELRRDRCHQMGGKMTREIPAASREIQFQHRSPGTRTRIGPGWRRAFRLCGAPSKRARPGTCSVTGWTESQREKCRPAAASAGLGTQCGPDGWDFSIPTGFPHDTTTTNKFRAHTNAYGPIYSPDWAAGAFAVLDPTTNEKYMLNVPLPNEEDRKKLKMFSEPEVYYDSLFWGDETKGHGYRNDPMNAGPSMMDSKGRIWFNITTRLDLPDYCKAGSNNPVRTSFIRSRILRIFPRCATRSPGSTITIRKRASSPASIPASAAGTRHLATTRTKLSTAPHAG